MIAVLDDGVSCAICHEKLHWTPLSYYCNHVIDCSVQLEDVVEAHAMAMN